MPSTLINTVCLAAALSVLTLVQTSFAAAAEDSRVQALAARERALANPFDEVALTNYLATLPKIGERYLVEGDIRLTAQEIREDLVAQAAGPRTTTPGPELIVAVHDGELSYWKEPEKRILTYAVRRASFGNEAHYSDVIAAMARATEDWEQACSACRVDFRHEQAEDGAPSLGRVTFIVEQVDAAGAFIAAAFFPHDPEDERRVLIDPSFFAADSYPAEGVLRHELGHVLGYRHEHIQSIPGCFREGGRWLPLSPYDPHSVMHYFCGGGGTLSLELTDVDKTSHQALHSR